ncbi:hypothetical protein CRG98_022192 [Punica granatum]|uniref:Uncharacterized protein n=1 Tax=Punica granatum TaxID=22663 RepID=A0A2I0JMB9_PUNGR|nr:hypothetical protein CRG98_022192 [Punica granatum]
MTLVVSECGCKAAVLRIGLTLGTATRLVAWESENRGWFTRKENADLPRIDFMTCDSSSGNERLRIPWNWESESAVVLACLWLYRIAWTAYSVAHCARERFPLGRLTGIGESIGDRVGIDNLATSLGDPLSTRCPGFVLCPVSLFETPRLCITEAALGVPHRQTPPSPKYKEKVRDKFSGKRELAHRSSPVVNVPL